MINDVFSNGRIVQRAISVGRWASGNIAPIEFDALTIIPAVLPFYRIK
jgi:hypothetical protein